MSRPFFRSVWLVVLQELDLDVEGPPLHLLSQLSLPRGEEGFQGSVLPQGEGEAIGQGDRPLALVVCGGLHEARDALDPEVSGRQELLDPGPGILPPHRPAEDVPQLGHRHLVGDHLGVLPEHRVPQRLTRGGPVHELDEGAGVSGEGAPQHSLRPSSSPRGAPFSPPVRRASGRSPPSGGLSASFSASEGGVSLRCSRPCAPA